MNFDVTRDQWVERFAMHLSQLHVGTNPSQFESIGKACWPDKGHLAPDMVAEEEFAAGLSATAAAVSGADFQNTHGLGEESRFERTERIPVERIHAAGEYVRDTGEWIERCVARVLALDPIIKAEEARRSVSELAELERWRLMKPEAAAEQLYTPIRPR